MWKRLGYLVKKDNDYLCSECRMRQKPIEECCKFCRVAFSNYENIMIKEIMEKEKEKQND